MAGVGWGGRKGCDIKSKKMYKYQVEKNINITGSDSKINYSNKIHKSFVKKQQNKI